MLLVLARNCLLLLLLLVLLVPAVHITLFYLARQFSEESKDCSENNITATNLVKPASRDFQYTRGAEEEETASGSTARKRKLDKTFLANARARARTHTHTHNCTCCRQSSLDK